MLKKELVFPDTPAISPACKDLITRLLNKVRLSGGQLAGGQGELWRAGRQAGYHVSLQGTSSPAC